MEMGEGWAEQMEMSRGGGWAGEEGDLLVKRPWKVKVRSLALAKRWGKGEHREPLGAEGR